MAGETGPTFPSVRIEARFDAREAARVRRFIVSGSERQVQRDWAAVGKLDLNSLYALNPYAKKGEDPHLPMTPDQLHTWIGEGDSDHQTYAITNAKDNNDRPVGFIYVSRGDDDSVDREKYVAPMVGLGKKGKLRDLNADAPERDDYVQLLKSGLRQFLPTFFQKNPDDVLVFYIEHNDLVGETPDRDDYEILMSLGFREMGRVNYDNPGTKGTAEFPNDHVFAIRKSDFEQMQKLRGRGAGK